MYEVRVWSERNRNHLMLEEITDNGEINEIFSLWDDDVLNAVEDGFIDPRNLEQSCVEYAKQLGSIKNES